MHPEMHLVLHRQQERELEARLAQALAWRERGVMPAPRPGVRDSWLRLVEWERAFVGRARTRVAEAASPGLAPACCPA